MYVPCPPQFTARIIGTDGVNIRRLQQQSGAQLRVDTASPTNFVVVTGPPDAVDRAVALIQAQIAYAVQSDAQLYGAYPAQASEQPLA